jgi:apolipoprotein N-acyltransferase
VTDRSVQDIIAAARAQKKAPSARVPMRRALLLSITSGLLFYLSFAPVEFSPLAWLAPVPLLCLVRLEEPTRRMGWACYLGGLAFFAPALHWMRLGDPLMYFAWWSLAGYLAAYFPIAVGLMRVAVHRWKVPLVIAAPLIWVGLEFARAHLMTGFAWYFVGHSQYRWLELIQISDVVGAYGVSFVMIATAAALTGMIPASWMVRLGLINTNKPMPADEIDQPAVTTRPTSYIEGMTPAHAWPVLAAVAYMAAVWGYGAMSRSQADFQHGPRVALIQGNFPASIRIAEDKRMPQLLTHLKLTGLAVREQPDIIVWPEAMFRWPLASAPAGWTDEQIQKASPYAPVEFWRDTNVARTLINEAEKTNAAMIFGIECVDLKATGVDQFNSALLVNTERGIASRYDKIHLVPFGEYIPFQKSMPWLSKFTPYPMDFGLDAGTQAVVFEHRDWRMIPVICFEDTVPHLVRHMIGSATKGDTDRPVDMLVNLSNDGWFHGSSGLDQHLITSAFRAVECRTPLIRAVNTGVSAVIDGDGAIREPDVMIDGDTLKKTTFVDPQTGRWRKQVNAALVQAVPLDNRRSLYVRYGDWFALLCCAACVFCALSAIRFRRPVLTPGKCPVVYRPPHSPPPPPSLTGAKTPGRWQAVPRFPVGSASAARCASHREWDGNCAAVRARR